MTDTIHAPTTLDDAASHVCSTVSRTPIVWVSAPPGSDDAFTASLARRWRARDGDYWQANAPNAEGSAFGPFRSLIRQVLPLVAYDLRFLQECAAELVTLLPDLASRPEFGEAQPLTALVPMPVALARMLPQESEYVFRLITRGGWLVTRVCRESVASGKQPLVVFTALDRCDRPTLLAIYHLCLRAAAGDLRLVLVGSGSPLSANVVRDGLFDAECERQLLLGRLIQRVQPAQITIEGPGGMGRTLTSGYDDEACALRQVQVSTSGHVIRKALALSSRYGNVEAVLNLARRGISEGHTEQGLLVEMWQAVGIAHATIGNYGEALEAFANGMKSAEDAILRARLAMFLALVCAKRTAAFPEAMRYLEQGYRAIDGLENPDATLERGWLNNVAALVAYRQGDHARAVAITLATLQMMKQFRDEESTGLKTNLVTNYSVLLEHMGDLAKAQQAWELFRVFLGQASQLFSKRYHFRDAGLHYRAGRLVEAGVAYRAAFQAAGSVGDLVGLEATAHACAHLAERQRDYEKALEWASRIPPILDRLGDAQRQPAVATAIAAYQDRLETDEPMLEPPSTSLHLPQHLVMP